MKEQLYTIPVNEAFDSDCECPLCLLRENLEKDSIEFTLGPSYMEDDIRAETDKIGFCNDHLRKMYLHKNRLGLALMMHTHMKKIKKDLEHSIKSSTPVKKGFFSKTVTDSTSDYISNLSSNCYICNRINKTFDRYLATVFYCYFHDEEFRKKMKTSKGFCLTHYGALRDYAIKHLSEKKKDEFLAQLDETFLSNFARVTDDLEWFIDKFDYRNEDKPWKNSKDAVPRSLQKANGLTEL